MVRILETLKRRLGKAITKEILTETKKQATSKIKTALSKVGDGPQWTAILALLWALWAVADREHGESVRINTLNISVYAFS